MVMKGRLFKPLNIVDPKLYGYYVVIEKGTKELCVRIQKSLYGLLQSALLFYLKLVTDIKSYGFKMNTYDP